MNSKNYILTRIDGEYAYIKELDNDCNDDLFIALALLPIGVDVGTKLCYENFEFSVISE